MPRLRVLRAEDGSASLEFITAGLVLLVPLVYLVLCVGTIQGAALAAEGAARQAARVYVISPDPASANAALDRAIEVGLADFGVRAEQAEVNVSCEHPANGCLTRRNQVTVTLALRVGLPLVPDVLGLHDVASVPVQASATGQVSRFWGAAP